MKTPMKSSHAINDLIGLEKNLLALDEMEENITFEMLRISDPEKYVRIKSDFIWFQKVYFYPKN